MSGDLARDAADDFIEDEVPRTPFRKRLRMRPWTTLAAVLCLTLAAVGAFVASRVPNHYEASALIKIEETAPYIVFDSDRGVPKIERYVQTQIETMRSPMVLELLLARPEISSAPEIHNSRDRLHALQSNLRIDRISDSDLFNVTYTSQSPKLSSTVANAVVSEYLTIQSRSSYERYQRVIDLLEEERFRRKTDVETLKKRVMALSGEVTGRDPFGLGATLDVRRTNDPISRMYLQLAKIDDERVTIQAQIQALREIREATDAGASGDASDVAAWQTAIDDLKSLLADVQSEDKSWETNAAYKRLADSIGKQQAALDKLKGALADLKAKSAQSSGNRKPTLTELEIQLNQLDIRRRILSDEFKNEYDSQQAGNAKMVELSFAQAELDREQKVFEKIADRKLAMQTESRAPARVSVQQSAPIPLVPVGHLPNWRFAIGVASSLLAVCGLMLLVSALQSPGVRAA